MTTATIITPDTDLFTYTANGAGSTLEDGFLGTMTATEYVELVEEDGDEKAIEALCEHITNALGDAYWTDEADAEAHADDLPRYYSLEEFTPREAHRRIMEIGRKEIEMNADA